LSLERTGRDRNDRISEALQDEMTDGFLRSRYEAAVVALCGQVAAMRGDGASPETIARAVHVERRRLTAAFKALTPEPWRSRIRTRTLAAYGDPIGPTIETLRVRAKAGTTSSTAQFVPDPGLRSTGRLVTPEDRRGAAQRREAEVHAVDQADDVKHEDEGQQADCDLSDGVFLDFRHVSLLLIGCGLEPRFGEATSHPPHSDYRKKSYRHE
jgi:hypothetical protein